MQLTPLLELAKGKNGIDDFLQITTELLQEVLGEKCIPLLFDAKQNHKSYMACHNPVSPTLLAFCCQIIEQNQSSLVQGKLLTWTREEDKFSLTLETLSQQEQLSSFLVIPLLTQQSYLGELCILHQHHQGEWTEKELTLIHYLGSQYTLMMEQNQEIEEQLWRQNLTRQITQKLNCKQDPEKLINEILELIGQNFQVEQVLLLSFHQTEFEIKQAWQVSQTFPGLVEQTISIEEWSALLDLPSSQTSKDWLGLPKLKTKFINLGIKAVQGGILASIPIYIQEKFFGLLVLQTTQSNHKLVSATIDLLCDIAQQVAIALYRLQTQSQWVNQQIAKLETEKRELEVAKRKTSEFLSHMTHELRTPLTGILSFSRMLQEQVYGLLNEKQTQYVDVIVASGEHLLSLVNDFLDLSKIEAHREEISLESMAVEDVCLASLALVRGRAEEGKLELKLEIDADVDFCKADQRRIKQILVNLLSNAIKFTEEGSVTLQVRRDHNYLCFSVIDTGIGIKTEEQQELFQPFKQIKNRLSRKHKGTGLGLALSQKLAQLHGGEITLISQEGKGSCFSLYLPIQ